MEHIWAVHVLHFLVLIFNFIMLMLWALGVKLLEVDVKEVSILRMGARTSGLIIPTDTYPLVWTNFQLSQYHSPICLHRVHRRPVLAHSDDCE